MQPVELILHSIKTNYLISSIANGVVFVGGLIFVLVIGVSTCGVGCLLIVFPFLNLGVMILDLIAMGRVLQSPSVSNYSFLKFTSICDIVAFVGIVPLIMGILNLQNLGKPEIYQHFHPGNIAS
jgi:hypothetical protein